MHRMLTGEEAIRSEFVRILESGMGQLLQLPDVEGFREWNRAKNKEMIDKRMNEAEAVRRFIKPGDYIGTELYGTVRCPMSLVHEIVRQGVRDLRVAGQGVLELDMLLAASLIKAIDLTYIGPTPAETPRSTALVGLPPRWRVPQRG